MSSYNFKGKIAVVTGAASGIGRELALQLSKEGCIVAAADYNKKDLEETVKMVKDAGGQASAHEVDISNAAVVTKFAADVKKKYGSIDILINNAGVTLFGKFDELAQKDMEWIMDINYWGAIYMTRAFMPEIKNKPESYLVNVASIFSVVGTGNQSAYSATKFALRGFTEALTDELQKFPITVMSVIPGGIKTNLGKNARFVKNGVVLKDTEKLAKRMEKIGRTTGAEAAAAIIKGMKKRKERILIGSDAWIIQTIQRFAPSKYNRVLGKIFG